MTKAHDHTWQTQSRHQTSEGTVRYQRCHCGRLQVRLGPSRVLVTIHDNHERRHLHVAPAPGEIRSRPRRLAIGIVAGRSEGWTRS